MTPAGYRKDAAPPIADHVIASVFEANHEQITLAIRSEIPVTRGPAGPEDFINVDDLPWLGASQDIFDADLAARNPPILPVPAIDMRGAEAKEQPWLELLLLDDADEDVVRAIQHFRGGHFLRRIENQTRPAALQEKSYSG